MDYIYEITGWKNGTEVQYIETPYKAKSNAIALQWRKSGMDAIDICKVQVGSGYLHSKFTHTLINGEWITSYTYIGEDE